MHAEVTDACIGCGLCVSACPEVFSMNGVVAVASPATIPPVSEDSAQRARDDCPVNAICLSAD